MLEQAKRPHRPLPRSAIAGLSVLLAAALTSSAGAAQAQDSDTALAERTTRRVIELSSGDFLRARTRRLEGGAWQLHQSGAWRDLPGVVRATEERELLTRADGLARQAGDDPVRRVALADWMARQGLANEALKELDRVLEADATQPDALRLLARAPRGLDPVARLSDAEELFDVAVAGGPALRELALARLAEVESEAALSARMRAAFGSGSVRTRATGARGLARFFPGEHLEQLLVRSVVDGSEDVRRASAQALGAADEPAVILPLVRALASDQDKVRVHAAQALGNAGYPAAVAPLVTLLAKPQSGGGGGNAPAANIFVGSQMAFIQDFDVEIAAGASVADPIVNVLTEGSVLDARVQGITQVSYATQSRYVRGALGKLTGANPGSTNRAWLKWWQENRADWSGGDWSGGDSNGETEAQASSTARR